MAEELQGKEYSMEAVERAEDLYCVDGHTFDAVSTLTGISMSTLKRWSERYSWQDKRERIRQARSSVRTDRIVLHAELFRHCLKTLNPQDAFAAAAIDGIVQRAAETAIKSRAAAPQQENLRSIRTEEDAVKALEEAIEMKLNGMLSNPGTINLAALRDVKQVMDFVRDLKARTKSVDKSDRKGGLSEDAIRQIEEQVLGITRK